MLMYVTKFIYGSPYNIDGIVQDYSNSSALAMELM